ncbi:MAG: DUF1822 family protein [Leptolyngbyaceae cyanobacterium MO_188.B28]|nr:DUF1822 family protein [Leptolyngbyaceae cyanobacterium MO_188.B28]
MDIDIALNFVNTAILAQANRCLSAPEIAILRGTWQGLTYDQMAKNSDYSTNYLMRDIGPKFWRLLSETFGEPVSKTNLRVVLQRISELEPEITDLGLTPDPTGVAPEPASRVEASSQPLFATRPAEMSQRQDWDNAPEVSSFVGRSAELAKLKQWILQDGCRLLTVRGLSGVGKTVLAKVFAEQIQAEFDRVIWRSLNQVPPLNKFMADLIKILPPSSDASHFSPPNRKGDLLSQLIASLKDSRCLIILDGAEGILHGGQLAGQYRPGYEDYGEFFRHIGEDSHQSCWIVTGLENPRDVVRLEGKDSPVRSLALSGWSEAEAESVLQSEQLAAQSSWPALIDQYQGNPAALKSAARLIRALFNGDVAEFMKHQSFVFEEVGALVGRSFKRLSSLEKEILYWLISEPHPISVAALQHEIPWSIPFVKLLEALESLKQRLLIVTTQISGQSAFILPPMVKEYVARQLLEEISSPTVSQTGRSNSWTTAEELLDLTPSAKADVNLGQWLQQAYDPAWSPIEGLLGGRHSLFSPRLRSMLQLRGEGLVRRFKPIRLGTQTDSPEVALLVAISAKANQKVEIRVQVHPLEDDIMLPANLQLRLINNSGETLRLVQSQQQDNFIQLPRFRGEPKERFSLQVVLDDINVTEEFVI